MNNHLQIRTPMPLRALSVMALAALLLVANAPALAAGVADIQCAGRLHAARVACV